MNAAFPYDFDDSGRTASPVDDDRHIRDLIEQILFTAPGERVNRPTLGSGVLRLIFAGNGPALASATQLAVQTALQQWLGDLISVQGVEIESIESTLRITVRYLVLRTQERRTAQFTGGLS